ncbi:unnamed protein product [Peniophora sp. CBMAI 1063]|nr:unnamed protein product [Peniophora sp. CBMAI 1063]
MLTLFKPWNHPLELKQQGQTWQQAFNQHVFTERQQTVMGYFHVRYECNDARDDCRAQRVGAAKDMGMHWVGGQFIHELDKESWATDKMDMIADDVAGIDNAFQDVNIGSGAAAGAVAVAGMKHALESVGWMDSMVHDEQKETSTDDAVPQSNEGDNDSRDIEGLSDDTGQETTIDLPVDARTTSGWRELLANSKRSAIAAKFAGAPAVEDDGDKVLSNQRFWEDEVRKVDKTFLSKSFKADVEKEDAGAVIDKIVSDFHLNEEQERAFRIIANHSLVNTLADPLRMYIGGMAGTGKSQVIKAVIKFFEERGKSYAFLILAPTGSAASLVSGSTYHSDQATP